MAELDSHILRDIPFTVIWSKYIYLKYFILRKTLYLIIKTMSQFANYHYLCQVIRRSWKWNWQNCTLAQFLCCDMKNNLYLCT